MFFGQKAIKNKKNKIIGSPVSPLVPIHPMLQRLYEQIKKRGLRSEGIFRKSIRKSLFQEVVKKTNSGVDVSLRDLDINIIASLIKYFFAELPEEMFLEEHASRLAPFLSKDHSLFQRELFSILQPHYQILLCSIIDLLYTVDQYKEYNKMDSENLGRIFGSALFRIKSNNISVIMKTTETATRIVKHMIDNYYQIFGDDETQSLLKLFSYRRVVRNFSYTYEKKRMRRKYWAKLRGDDLSKELVENLYMISFSRYKYKMLNQSSDMSLYDTEEGEESLDEELTNTEKRLKDCDDKINTKKSKNLQTTKSIHNINLEISEQIKKRYRLQEENKQLKKKIALIKERVAEIPKLQDAVRESSDKIHEEWEERSEELDDEIRQAYNKYHYLKEVLKQKLGTLEEKDTELCDLEKKHDEIKERIERIRQEFIGFPINELEVLLSQDART